MEVNYAFLCQAAVPQGPLVTIVGAGADQFAVPALPAMVGGTVAASFSMDRDEIQRPHTIHVNFIDDDGHAMHGVSVPGLQLPAHPQAGNQRRFNVNAILNLNGAQLQTAGRYSIDVVLDGRPVKRIPFEVVLTNARPPDQGPPMPQIL